ncbi:MAG: c-type cytochrome, partial [Verrucomicrobiaceae bacterium]
TSEPSAPSRILALWALSRLGALKDETLNAAMKAGDSAIKKNAYLIAESAGIPINGAAASAGIGDKDARVRLATLRALGASAMTSEASAVLLASNPKLDDVWSKAAAAAANSKAPTSQLEQVLSDAGGAGQTEESVRAMAAALAAGSNKGQIPGVLNAASKSGNAPLVIATLEELSNVTSPPPGAAGAVSALRVMLSSSNKKVAAAALPIAASWDKGGSLAKESTKVAGELLTIARDPKAPEAARAEAVKVLLPARSLNKFILPHVSALLAQPQPEALAKELVVSLAATGEPEAGTVIVNAYPTLPEALQEDAYNAVVSRPEWAKLFLDAVEAKKIAADKLAPARVSRLTANPDSKIAERAKGIFGAGSASGSKDELVTKLLPEIEKPGNVPNGKTLFSAMCATCHKIEGQGNVFGPNLDGIGAHPVRELLTHIVNPGLVVDDEHRTWNIKMKDGTLHSALIGSENEARVQIRMPAGVTLDLPTADIVSREKGTNSLMPEGLEAIGTENLRDIIAYIRSVAPQNH